MQVIQASWSLSHFQYLSDSAPLRKRKGDMSTDAASARDVVRGSARQLWKWRDRLSQAARAARSSQSSRESSTTTQNGAQDAAELGQAQRQQQVDYDWRDCGDADGLEWYTTSQNDRYATLRRLGDAGTFEVFIYASCESKRAADRVDDCMDERLLPALQYEADARHASACVAFQTWREGWEKEPTLSLQQERDMKIYSVVLV